MNSDDWQCLHCDEINRSRADTCSKCHKSCYDTPATIKTPIETSYQGVYLIGSWFFIPLMVLASAKAIVDETWWFPVFCLPLLAFTILNAKSKFLINDAIWFKRIALLYTPAQTVLIPSSILLSKDIFMSLMVIHIAAMLYGQLNMRTYCRERKIP